MRTAFIEALLDIAQSDKRVWLMTGDLGFSVLEPFMERFPERYINAGVAEQNMTGMAAGLASLGNIVFTYSIANFPTLRCIEQIRNDACYHNLPVRIVSVGGGVAYGSQGYNQHGREDISIMRSLPNMTVLAPGDPVETRLAVKSMIDLQGPCYLRLGKAGEPVLHAREPEFTIGQAIEMRSGRDVTIISTGGILEYTLKQAERLKEKGIDASVISMHTIKPFDAKTITEAARKTGLIITVEEHSLIGGLGSATAEVLAESLPGARLARFAMPDEISENIGSQSFLRRRMGDLTDFVLKAIHEKG